MPTKNEYEPFMIEEVRRWRKAVFEQDANKSLETRREEERLLAKRLGLDHLPIRASGTSPPSIAPKRAS